MERITELTLIMGGQNRCVISLGVNYWQDLIFLYVILIHIYINLWQY